MLALTLGVMHLGRWASFTGTIAKISFLGLLVSALSAQVGEVRLRGGFPEDWTHHRIKFNTATLHQHPEIAAHEPRAAIQLYREAAARFSPNLTTFSKPEFTPTRPHADWSYNLGTAARVQAGQFPAKWNSNPLLPITNANCTTDYVLYALNVTGVTGGQASMVAFYNLYSRAAPALCSGGNPWFCSPITHRRSPTVKSAPLRCCRLMGRKWRWSKQPSTIQRRQFSTS